MQTKQSERIEELKEILFSWSCISNNPKVCWRILVCRCYIIVIPDIIDGIVFLQYIDHITTPQKNDIYPYICDRERHAITNAYCIQQSTLQAVPVSIGDDRVLNVQIK